MGDIIYFGIMLAISILSFVMGKFVFPKIPNDNMEIIEKWAIKIVHFCRQFLAGEEGEKKMEKAVSLLDQIQHKYDMNLTEEELKAIIQYAYDKMKQETTKNE